MPRDTPRSSDDRRELEEAASDLGISVDELEHRIAVEQRERDEERRRRPIEVAPPADPARFKHDPATIALGRRKIAELRTQLAQRAQ